MPPKKGKGKKGKKSKAVEEAERAAAEEAARIAAEEEAARLEEERRVLAAEAERRRAEEDEKLRLEGIRLAAERAEMAPFFKSHAARLKAERNANAVRLRDTGVACLAAGIGLGMVVAAVLGLG